MAKRRSHLIATLLVLVVLAQLLIAFLYGFDKPVGEAGLAMGVEDDVSLAHRLRLVAEHESSLLLIFAVIACAALPASAALLRTLAGLAVVHGALDVYVFAFDFSERGSDTYPSLRTVSEGASRAVGLAIAVTIAIWALRAAREARAAETSS